MAENWEIYADWNPWHGCTKISSGCTYCYVYRQDEMYGSEISSSECRKTGNFNLPVKRKRDKSWKIESGKMVFTCFTSDFLLKDADPWRPECWKMMKERSDLWFYFFTKRIDRFMECIPDDWGDGYDNVRENGGAMREKLSEIYLNELKSFGLPYTIIGGQSNERREMAVKAVKAVLKS